MSDTENYIIPLGAGNGRHTSASSLTGSFLKLKTKNPSALLRAGLKLKTNGFTLVELIVVISIIALLISITMPALAAARRAAKKTICKSNLHSCALSFRMYLDENKNVMPVITNMPNDHISNPDPSLVHPIFTVIKKYLGDQKALQCPADIYPPDNTHNSMSTYYEQQGSSYEYNIMLALVKIEGTGLTFTRPFPPYGKVTIAWADFWIMRDYSGFHGKPSSYNSDGTPANWQSGSYMYLYADTLVADRERKK